MSEKTIERGGRGGILVLAVLALVFFALLGSIFFFAKRETAPPPPPATTNLFVIPARLKVRTEPVANAPVVTSAERGAKLTLVEDRGAWVRVKAADGLAGWAERSSLEGEAEHQRRVTRIASILKLPPLDGVVQQRSALYSGPGIFYPLVGELQRDVRVKVYTRDHDFYAVDHEGEVAYAEVDAIDLSGSRGSAQLDVGESEAPATATAPPETASAAPPEVVPPVAAPEPPPEPPASHGVYAAVPLGGTPPVIIDRVKPRYPAMARRAGTQGVVVIRAIIRRDGTIDDIDVIQDLPNGLGEAARDAVERWRFRPATYRGEPIDVYYTVTINFRLAG